MRKYNVAVIGGCGHVGLPFSIVNALARNSVTSIDISSEAVESCRKRVYPYVEENGEASLDLALSSGHLKFTTDQMIPINTDVVAIMIGTPVDSENNPRLDDIMNYVETQLLTFLYQKDKLYKSDVRYAGLHGPLILLRSTVAPGTTDLIKKRIEEEGYKCVLAFCPERVIQGKSIVETSQLPQIIGAYSKYEFDLVANYFSTFNNQQAQFLTPREAEIAKLITNMTRYVNFALANEFYMIGDQQKVDIHKVIDAANYEYPRLQLPKPGPNVGGPCLFKDGRFLLEDVPFVDLIQTAFVINEGMPQYIFNRMMQANPNIKSVRIYGMTFKADNDDIRNSLSFKFKKICERHGLKVSYTDPYYGDSGDFEPGDAYVIMTPHTEYHGLFDNTWKTIPEGTVLVDVWKIGGKITKVSYNGIVVI